MSHNIEIRDGKASMAWVGQTPWHGLGKKVHNDITSEEMLVEANLNWKVEKVPLFGKVGGKNVKANHEFLIRDVDNRILDEITGDWNPVQNSEAFAFFKEFVDSGKMKMDTAGSLKDGELVWALAKINDSFEVFKGDKIDGYMLFVNPHRFGQSIDIRFTPVRVVCNNTLSLALHSEHNGRIRLTHRAAFDPEKAKMMLGIAHNKMEVYKEAALVLGKKKYTKKSLSDYVNAVFPVATKDKESKKESSVAAKSVLELVEQQPGAEFAPGTFWSAFNACTFYIDHVAGRTQDNRLSSAWFGYGQKVKNEALQVALKFAA